VSEPALAACAQELEVNLNAETALYEQLRELARETDLAARRDDNEAVAELMTRNNDVITELRRVSAATDSLRQDFGRYTDVPDKIQSRVSEALARAVGALEELLVLERGIEQPLRSIMDSTQAKLWEAARGRRLIERYRPARVTEPRFMDKRR
jgi:nicotinate-nucleotide pyrophosphorylase